MNPFRSHETYRLEEPIQQRRPRGDNEAEEIKNWHFGFACFMRERFIFCGGIFGAGCKLAAWAEATVSLLRYSAVPWDLGATCCAVNRFQKVVLAVALF